MRNKRWCYNKATAEEQESSNELVDVRGHALVFVFFKIDYFLREMLLGSLLAVAGVYPFWPIALSPATTDIPSPGASQRYWSEISSAASLIRGNSDQGIQCTCGACPRHLYTQLLKNLMAEASPAGT